MPESLERIDTETALLLAVRNILRDRLKLTNDECEIELDEEVPETVGESYTAVIPDGVTPGPAQDPSGGVLDEIYAVRVSVIMRNRLLPADKIREMFLYTSNALNRRIEDVRSIIDFQYDVQNMANLLIREGGDTLQGFIEPLRFTSRDDRPRIADPLVFRARTSGSSKAPVGLIRSISFGGARRMRERIQL